MSGVTTAVSGPAATGTAEPGQGYEFSPDLVALLSPLSESAESVRTIRTHLLTQHVHAGRRALAICGPALGVGSTFLAANLAVAMSQTGLQVLLFDADLRNPSINRLIKPPEPVEGLADCLAAPEFRPGDYIQADVLPGLSVMFAGHAALNAPELLAGDRFEKVMNACLRDYDLTVIDTPPGNAYADVRRIASVAGYALVVARRNKTLVPDVRTLVDQLESDGAVVFGTVMNA